MTNKKRKKINKYFILSFFLIAFFAVPFIVFSATSGTNNFESVKFTPQIEFPGTGISGETDLSNLPNDDGIITSDLLSKYIKAIYQYGLSVAGILAAVIIMGAGVIWLTSAGDSGKINKAKQYIFGSLIGVFLLFGAYIILNTINPNLIELKPIEISTISDISDAACSGSDGYIYNKDCLPQDAVIKFLCLREGDTCANTNPPSIQMDYSVCYDQLNLDVSCDPSSPYNRKTCCAKSETINNEADNFCKNKNDYTKCKPLLTLSEEYGRCLNGDCVSELVCCECYYNCLYGVCASVSCKNNVSVYECNRWCSNNHPYGGAGFKLNPNNYQCANVLLGSQCKLK